jgi:hypothetical protein
MLQPDEYKPITLAEWKAASSALLSVVSAEKKNKYRNRLLNILEVLNVSSRTKSETPLIFNATAWSLLEILFNKLSKLSQPQQENCVLFIKTYGAIKNSMGVQQFQNALVQANPAPQALPDPVPIAPNWYLKDPWKNVFNSLSAYSITQMMRTSMFFYKNQDLKQTRELKLVAEKHPLIMMFKGNPYNLLTANHFYGLAKILKFEISEFTPDNIVKVEQVTDKSGKLIGLGLYCTVSPFWILRNGLFSLTVLTSESKKDDLHHIEFCEKSIARIKYSPLITKCGSDIFNHFENSGLDSLLALNNIVADLSNNYSCPYVFEQRLSNFNPKTKTVDSTKAGELQTLMFKITLLPECRGITLKTIDDFRKIFIPALKMQLGDDNFNRLVRNYGEALDKRGFIEFNVEELRKGLHVENPPQFSL